MEQKTLVLIDSNAIIHRAYHALPKNMSTSTGELTNAVYGFATTLIKVLEDLHPTHIAASFDVGKATERISYYKEYKATRVAADQELYDQIPKVRELLKVLKIPIYDCPGHEADDCIGTISSKFELRQNVTPDSPCHSVASCEGWIGNPENNPSAGGPDPRIKSEDDKREVQDDNIIDPKEWKIYIISGDKDIFQLIDGNIFVYWLKRGLSEAGIVNRKVIEVEWGLQPEDFIDLKALAGDPSDNIPGVPNIGAKTATDLLLKFDSLVKLYEILEENFQFSIFNFQSISNDPNFKTKCEKIGIRPRIVGLLIGNKDQAFLSQKLATINRNVPIDFHLEDTEWGDYDRGKLREFFERMQFHSLLKRFGAEEAPAPKTKEAKVKKEKDEQLKLL